MKLFFQSYGKGSPLIILHGLFGSSDNWHTLAKKFGKHFHVYAIDQRNHGRSPHDGIHTYRAMADDLADFFKEHAIPRAYLLGHSMGGKTAMQFALDHSSLVSRLLVVDIAPKAYPARHDHIFDGLFSLDVTKHHSRSDVEQALAGDIPNSAVRQFLLKNLKRTDEGFAWKINLEALRRQYDAMSAAISGQVFPSPVLFIRGARSDYVLDSDVPGMRELFPHSLVRNIDAGHWIHAEAPEEFYRIALDFLLEGS